MGGADALLASWLLSPGADALLASWVLSEACVAAKKNMSSLTPIDVVYLQQQRNLEHQQYLYHEREREKKLLYLKTHQQAQYWHVTCKTLLFCMLVSDNSKLRHSVGMARKGSNLLNMLLQRIVQTGQDPMYFQQHHACSDGVRHFMMRIIMT